MRTKFSTVCLIGVVAMTLWCLGPVAVGADKDAVRTWSDAKGKNKIKAKFVKLDGDTVTLEKEDGDEVEIELKKLSAADQKFVADAMKDEDNPFKNKSDDPFKSKAKPKKGSTTKEKDSDDDSGGPKTVAVNLANAEQIALGAPGDEWKIEVPVGEGRPAGSKPKAIPLPNKANFFEGIKSLAFSRGDKSKVVAVGFLWDAHNTEGGLSRIALCDLNTGKCAPPASSPGKMVPIAVHDDGRQIVMRREEFGFGNQDRLEVWTPKGAKVSKSVSWIPYEGDQGGPRDVMWAEFVDGQRLLTSSRNGKVVLWKFPEIEPIFQFHTVDGAVPALSPDRKLIAYSNGSDVGLINIDKQEVVAQQPTPNKLQWPYMAFSPTGKRIACVAFDKVLVWDVATGKLEREIPCTGIHVHGSIEYPDDNFVLAGGKFLIDVENQLKLWTFNGGEQVRAVDGITYFAVTDGDKKPGALVPLQLPHGPAKDLLKKALTDPALFVLRAGSSVRIDVNGIPDAAQRERVANALSKRLETIECKGGTTGTIDIVATVEGPKERELQFIHTGTYKFKEYLMKVKFVYQGQSAWESVQTNAPFIVHLKNGENMEGHLRQQEKPNYEFFDQVQLPKFLQKPSAGGAAGGSLTLGQSNVTVNGIR